MSSRAFSPSLRVPAALLLIGQLLYIVVTQFHAGGEANDHRAIFAVYAGNGIWVADHLGQFAATAIMLAGLLGLFFALEARGGMVGWTGRFGAARRRRRPRAIRGSPGSRRGREQAGGPRMGQRA